MHFASYVWLRMATRVRCDGCDAQPLGASSIATLRALASKTGGVGGIGFASGFFQAPTEGRAHPPVRTANGTPPADRMGDIARRWAGADRILYVPGTRDEGQGEEDAANALLLRGVIRW